MGKEAEVWNSKDDGNFMNQVMKIISSSQQIDGNRVSGGCKKRGNVHNDRKKASKSSAFASSFSDLSGGSDDGLSSDDDNSLCSNPKAKKDRGKRNAGSAFHSTGGCKSVSDEVSAFQAFLQKDLQRNLSKEQGTVSKLFEKVKKACAGEIQKVRDVDTKKQGEIKADLEKQDLGIKRERESITQEMRESCKRFKKTAGQADQEMQAIVVEFKQLKEDRDAFNENFNNTIGKAQSSFTKRVKAVDNKEAEDFTALEAKIGQKKQILAQVIPMLKPVLLAGE